MIIGVVGSCALLLAACAGAPKQSPQRRLDQGVSTIEEAVQMFVEMGEVVISAGDDCGLMASGVDRWMDANGARREKIHQELSQARSPKTEEAYRQSLVQHVDVLIGMKSGIDWCQKHAGFLRAWARLDDSEKAMKNQ